MSQGLGSYQPIFGSQPPQYSPFGNMGGMGALALQLAMPWFEGQMQDRNMTPGQFLPFQNMYDQHRGRQYYLAQQQVMKDAAQLDRTTYEEFFTGGSDMAGTPDSPRRRAAVKENSDMVASLAPILSQLAPDAFDMAHGSRGSALVMAQALHRSGQNSIDPMTGRVGQSADTTKILSREIFNTLYGPDANLAEMKGIGAGSAGMMFEQLQHRGLGGDRVGSLSDRDKLKLIADADSMEMGRSLGVHSSEIRKQSKEAQRQLASGDVDMSKLDESLSGDMMASFDATKIQRKLKDMSGAVSAMRDIFGDAGHPDAPMQELMSGLEALTQGGMTTMSPEKLEQSLRKTQALATNVGITVEAAMGLMAGGAQQSDALGLDRGFAVTSTQQAMAFGGAVGQTGKLDTPAYGSLDRERLMAYDQRLRLTAAASPLANRMNAILRLTSEGAAEGPAAEVAKMIRAGETDKAYEHIKDDASYLKLMEASGVNQAVGNAALRSKHANQEYGLDAGTGDQARLLQARTDIAPIVRNSFADATHQALGGEKLTSEQRIKVTHSAGAAVQKALMGMTNEQRRTTSSRNDIMAAAAEQSLTKELKAAGIVKTEAEIKAMARDIAVGGYGALDQRVYSDKSFGGMGIEGVLQLHDKDTLRAQKMWMREAESDAAMRTSLAGFGTDNPFVRMVDAVRDAKPGTGVDDIALKVLGGVSSEEHAKLNPLLRGLGDATQDFERAERAPDGMLTTKGNQQRTAAAKRIAALRSGGSAAKDELQGIATKLGVKVEDLSEQTINTKVDDKDEATKMYRSVVALNAASKVGGIDAQADKMGYKIGTSVNDTERAKGQAILSTAMATEDLKFQMGSGPSYALSDRNVKQFSTLAAIAERHKEKLGIETPKTAEEMQQAVQKLFENQKTLPLTDKEQLDMKTMQKQIEREGNRGTMKLSGSLNILNMKNALVEASATNNDLFSGGGMPATG